MKIAGTILFVFSAWALFAQSLTGSYYQAWNAQKNKNWKIAIENYRQAIVKGEFAAYARLYSGQCYENLNLPDSAIQEYVKANLISESIASYQLACIFAQKADAANACKYLTEHIKSDYKLPRFKIKSNKAFTKIESSPEWKKLWQQSYYSLIDDQLEDAEIALNKNKTADAEEQLTQFINQHEKNAKAYYLLALCYNLKNDNQAAWTNLEKALELKKTNPDFLLLKIKLAEQTNKTEFGLKAAETLWRLNNYNPDYMLLQIPFLTEMGKPDKAIEIAETYLNICPGSAEAIQMLALAYQKKQDYSDAIRLYDNLLQVNKKPEYYKARGEAYLKAYVFSKAESDFSLYLDLNLKNAEVYFQRGVARYEQKNDKGACHDWKKAMRLKHNEAAEAWLKNCKD